MRLFLFLALLFVNLLLGYFQYEKSRAEADAGNQISLLEINPEKVKLMKGGERPPRPPGACLEWGSFAGDDTVRATAALAGLQLGDKLTQRDNDPGYWVYIPPLKTQADADKKAAELKTRGVTDFYVMQDAGPWQFALSLGLFKTEEAATNYLAQLRQKNVRSAVSEARGAKTVIFVIRDPGDAVTAQIAALKTDFPSAQLKAVACAADVSPTAAKSN